MFVFQDLETKSRFFSFHQQDFKISRFQKFRSCSSRKSRDLQAWFKKFKNFTSLVQELQETCWNFGQQRFNQETSKNFKNHHKTTTLQFKISRNDSTQETTQLRTWIPPQTLGKFWISQEILWTEFFLKIFRNCIKMKLQN